MACAAAAALPLSMTQPLRCRRCAAAAALPKPAHPPLRCRCQRPALPPLRCLWPALPPLAAALPAPREKKNRETEVSHYCTTNCQLSPKSESRTTSCKLLFWMQNSIVRIVDS
jgi:hypothetical protein